MPAKNKGKGKQKGKGKGGGKGGNKGGKKPQHKPKQQQGGKHHQQKQQKQHNQQSKSSPSKKSDFIPKEKLNKLLSKELSNTYLEYTKKFSDYSTFFGIFTRHNQEQLKLILKHTIPELTQKYDNKFYKKLQKFEQRDINQFIFHGDVAVGAFICTEESPKQIRLESIAVLPAFQNCGFGSRLLVKLLDSCVLRPKVQSLVVDIPESNTKSLEFFKRFGFKSDSNDEKKSDENTSNGNDNKNKNIHLECNIKILRPTLMFAAKKHLKESESKSTSVADKTPSNGTVTTSPPN